MNKLYLRAPDEETMLASLKTAGLTREDEDGKDYIITTNVCVIGTMYQPTGNTITDDDGIEYPEMIPVEGYHVNVITDNVNVVNSLSSLVIEPNSPSYTWAE